MGNAPPTVEGLRRWIPPGGRCADLVKATDHDDDHNNEEDDYDTFDVIVIGMQEATWKRRSMDISTTTMTPNHDDADDHPTTDPTDLSYDSEVDDDDDDDDVGNGTLPSRLPSTVSSVSSSQAAATNSTRSNESSQRSGSSSGSIITNNNNNQQSHTKSEGSSSSSPTAKPTRLQEDSEYLRALLWETLCGPGMTASPQANSSLSQRGSSQRGSSNDRQRDGTETDRPYELLHEYQRGQMRLYVFVKRAFVPYVHERNVKAENTGLAGIYHNKGGIVMQFNLGRTRLSFLTAHLAAHEGPSYYKARNDNMREILRGARPNPKHLQQHDVAIVSHHMFVMGDLNHRINLQLSQDDTMNDDPGNSRRPSNANDGQASSPASAGSPKGRGDVDSLAHDDRVAHVVNLIRAGAFDELSRYDELTSAIRNKDVLCQFETPPCNFAPTFKMLREEGFQYKPQRVPSYTDRILYASADQLQNRLKVLAYEPCGAFATSDHKPVRGAFSVQLNDRIGLQGPNANDRDTVIGPFSLTFLDMKCSNLPAMDVDGKSDPYLMFVSDPIGIVHEGNSSSEKKKKKGKWPCTSYLQKTLNPEWKDSIELCIPETTVASMKGAMLFVTVMDYDMSSQDDLMCTLALNLSELVRFDASSDQEDEKVMHIQRPLLKYGREEGSISCTINIRRGMPASNRSKPAKKKSFMGRLKNMTLGKNKG